MYEAIKLLKELIAALSRRESKITDLAERNTIKVTIATIELSIEKIEKDLAKIQEGSYIF